MANEPVTNILPDASSAPASPLAAPTTAEAALAQRAALWGDKAFIKKYRDGDAAAKQIMQTLNMAISAAPTGDKLGAVLAGTATPGRFETITGSELGTSDLTSAVEGLRKDGHSDRIIREIIEGVPVSAERNAEAKRIKGRLMQDREWLQKYRAGSSDHVQQMRNINAVLAAPIAETK